ncbi:vacuolar protein sorting-associated protein VTA1 homolog isoform X2 [Branchiostoma floridae]|uniref:Vacuolar protein sorting-associated protein VTA1 homolog isoform X1 n=1 Tax=Branchiostoma floridae TaxID=7739 RepID=C3YXI8_BRAFL|nr:vacuolar protein sorting-associated protein VTA1 homolog isoform X1 [Branchiostoma floridae]XP_035687597.1 vacuolar protein sorting-associated protein VTA1 homolog isoform X2 [Branchiostoma floridae]|eukprot:XP_002598785.1 hypothetical protein BRAFLDRAFT_58151 [Branchiostoma floridae]
MAAAGSPLPPLPAAFKPVQHHLKTATDHDKRDPVIAYYCRLYSMQTAMKIDSKSPDCRGFLIKLMDQLEQMKSQLQGTEAITNEVVGQAHVESYALKMFLFADNQDRAANFNKSVVKSFYTASMLFDVLQVFGELSEDLIKHRKYARWKSAYIHDCLRKGETPMPGPLGGEEGGVEAPPPMGFKDLPPQQPAVNQFPPPTNQVPPGAHAPPTTPAETPSNPVPTQPAPVAYDNYLQPTASGGVSLTMDEMNKASKLCRYAISALQYEDVPEAINNLQKALRLLTTGKES